MKIKNISKGAMFSVIAACFQLIPVFFSGLFTFLTLLSTVPIYLTTRIRIRVGIICYLTASLMIIALSDLHEVHLFIFINGLTGLIIGIAEHKFNHLLIVVIVPTGVLISSILIMRQIANYNTILNTFDNCFYNLTLMSVISTLYIIFMRLFLHYCYKQLSKVIKL